MEIEEKRKMEMRSSLKNITKKKTVLNIYSSLRYINKYKSDIFHIYISHIVLLTGVSG